MSKGKCPISLPCVTSYDFFSGKELLLVPSTSKLVGHPLLALLGRLFSSKVFMKETEQEILPKWRYLKCFVMTVWRNIGALCTLNCAFCQLSVSFLSAIISLAHVAF